MQRAPIKIGVMGSASSSLSIEDWNCVGDLAERLGKQIAAAACVLITGELDGVPGRFIAAYSQHGGLAVGTLATRARLALRTWQRVTGFWG
jgi:SLOG cluster4 family